MSDPTTAPVAGPQSVEEPSLVPQSDADEPVQQGDAQPADDGGASTQDTAPELPKWVHQLTDDLKQNEVVNRHQKLTDLVSEYAEYAQKADRLVELPGDDADDETREQFYDRLRPDSPDAYDLEPPEIPNGFEYNEQREAEFREIAYTLGLSNQQAQQLYHHELQQAIKKQQIAAKAHQEKIAALRQEWGDDYDGNVREAQQAFKEIAKRLDDAGLAERMVQTGYGNDPDMLRTFYGIWQMIKPDTIVDGSVDGGGDDDVASTWYPETNFDS